MNLIQRWHTFREFLSDVKKEAGKVSWPGKDEVFGTTVVVIVYTVLVGVFLFLVDAAVTPLMNKLLSVGS